jgi:hypothetical protein
MQRACRCGHNVEVAFSNVRRSTFPDPEPRRGHIGKKVMVIWGVAVTVRSRSNHGALPAKAWLTAVMKAKNVEVRPVGDGVTCVRLLWRS